MVNVANISLTAAFSIVIFAGLVGNSLVILIISRNKFLRRKKPISIVLLNLALADSTVLLFLAPRHIFFSLIDPYPVGTTGDMLCKFVTGGNIAWIGAITSICTLLLIATERFYAVCRPHRYHLQFTRKLVGRLLILSWMFGLLFNLPLFIVVRYNDKIKFCVEDWDSDGILGRLNAVLWAITAGILPLLIMAYFYSNVIFKLWIKKGEVTEGQLVIRQIRVETRRRVSKALLVISFLYCTSWFPPLTNYILVYFQPENSFSNVTYQASVVMVAFNSAVNPMIYAFYSGLFREHLKNLLFRKLIPRRVMAMEEPIPASATNGLTVFAPRLKVLKFSDVMAGVQCDKQANINNGMTANELFEANSSINKL